MNNTWNFSGMTPQDAGTTTRRAFLQRGSLLLVGAAATCGTRRAAAEDAIEGSPVLRIGLLTDLHYADKPAAGTRHYRDTILKLREAVSTFNTHQVSMALELGDFIDAADEVETEIGYLKTVEAEFAKFRGDRHYVLGNHCVYTLTKQEFQEHSGAKATYYSFDQGEFHFIILDACFRSDGTDYGRRNFDWTDTNIPASQCEWLTADLESTDKKTIVFTHQRLDVENSFGIKNAKQVRTLLEYSGKVEAVFMGHNHENAYQIINGIHYCVLRAVVEGEGSENNGYCLLDLFQDGSIRVNGFGKQETWQWKNL